MVNSPSLLKSLRQWWILVIFIGFLIFFSLAAPGFFSLYNFVNLGVYSTELLVISLGQTFVIIAGGFDLSVGANVALSGVISALVMKQFFAISQNASLSIAMGILFGVAAGGGLGILNGLLVTKLKVSPFVVTLGTMGIARGVTFLITHGSSVFNLPPGVNEIGIKKLFNVLPIPIIVTIFLAVFAHFLLSKTLQGRYFYAIGGNREASLRAGIPVNKYIIKAYFFSGLCAAITGFLLAARFTAASPMAGQGAELESITAVVVGGTSLYGGKGSIPGTVAGALILAVLLVGLVVLEVEPYWQMVAVGIILIMAVFMDKFFAG